MYLKSLICAIAFVLAPLSANAATITEGASHDILSAPVFLGNADSGVGGVGSFIAGFYSSVDPTVGDFTAAVTGGHVSAFDTLTISWLASDMSTVLNSVIVTAGLNGLATTFTAPNLTQYLQLSWGAGTISDANVNFDVVGTIPLPAGGLLLLTALGGLGFARRRKQAA
ncbi:VPLPA-CTERM sorting domain-containing protein [Roseobacter sp. N2S]|uniref:VPLPA-CTERM sorting domain-containing protein n=1 Tax=Roseobacter sp. N2S TaxID=2663844 RepID=UPI00285C8717|nr:VPLPA-CTERM sorting domain-containing protein [Roseobacter sp. N2S]MDR6267661.1 hypothetical protein [Roseobacter sp. N2S]